MITRAEKRRQQMQTQPQAPVPAPSPSKKPIEDTEDEVEDEDDFINDDTDDSDYEEIDETDDEADLDDEDDSDEDYNPDDDSEMEDDHVIDSDDEPDIDSDEDFIDDTEAAPQHRRSSTSRGRKSIVPMQILNALRRRSYFLFANQDEDADDADEDNEDNEDGMSDEAPQGPSVPARSKKRKMNEETVALRKFMSKYTKEEQTYLKGLTPPELDAIKTFEKHLDDRNNIPDVPLRFKIITSAMDTGCKRLILQRLEQFQKMNDSAGEYFKLSNWLQSVSRLPLGIYHPLPVTSANTRDEIAAFLNHTKVQLDTIVYGHADAKNQLLRILAQWISNPTSKGHCIGIHGPPGIGKTSLIKNGISKALNLPFAFVPLGGASDASFLDGHAFTYEGSMYGKIAEVLMRTQCMNPVIFFDELDKVSETNKGEEISHVLTHLTDSTQNDKFNDKYFGEIDIDMSKALMVFSYNHDDKLDPILKDRMITIEVKGYDTEDKLKIADDFLIPAILSQYGFQPHDVKFSHPVLRAIIQRVPDEDGVRNLKRGIEAIVSWVNMYQYVPPPDTDPITLPYTVTEACVQNMVQPNSSARSKPPSAMYL